MRGIDYARFPALRAAGLACSPQQGGNTLPAFTKLSAFMNRSQLRIAVFCLMALVAAYLAPGWRAPVDAQEAAQGTAQEALKAKAPYIDGHVHLDDRGPAGVQSMLATI